MDPQAIFLLIFVLCANNRVRLMAQKLKGSEENNTISAINDTLLKLPSTISEKVLKYHLVLDSASLLLTTSNIDDVEPMRLTKSDTILRKRSLTANPESQKPIVSSAQTKSEFANSVSSSAVVSSKFTKEDVTSARTTTDSTRIPPMVNTWWMALTEAEKSLSTAEEPTSVTVAGATLPTTEQTTPTDSTRIPPMVNTWWMALTWSHEATMESSTVEETTLYTTTEETPPTPSTDETPPTQPTEETPPTPPTEETPPTPSTEGTPPTPSTDKTSITKATSPVPPMLPTKMITTQLMTTSGTQTPWVAIQSLSTTFTDKEKDPTSMPEKGMSPFPFDKATVPAANQKKTTHNQKFDSTVAKNDASSKKESYILHNAQKESESKVSSANVTSGVRMSTSITPLDTKTNKLSEVEIPSATATQPRNAATSTMNLASQSGTTPLSTLDNFPIVQQSSAITSVSVDSGISNGTSTSTPRQQVTNSYATEPGYTSSSASSRDSEGKQLWSSSAITTFLATIKNPSSVDYNKFNTKPETVTTTTTKPGVTKSPFKPSDDKSLERHERMSIPMIVGLVLLLLLTVISLTAAIFAIQWYRRQKTLDDSIALMSDRRGQRRPYYYYDTTM